MVIALNDSPESKGHSQGDDWAPGLFHVAGPHPDTLDSSRIVVVAIVRNEAWRLPFWLAYHRWLGVDRFIVVNNRSDDETQAVLARQQDVTLLDAPGRYQRIAWKREIIQRAPSQRWNLVLDADELFVGLPWVEGGLKKMVEWLDGEKSEAVVAVMVDCYPERLPLRPEAVSPIPWRRAPWFDPGPYLKWDAARGRTHHVFGGARERLLWPRWRYLRRIKHLMPRQLGSQVFGDGPPFIRKMPLLRNTPRLSFDSIHRSTGLCIAREMFAILHYKLDVDLDAKVASALTERQYADNSRDYEAYARLTKFGGVRVRNTASRVFTGAEELEAQSLLVCSPRFQSWLIAHGERFVGRDQAENEIWRYGVGEDQNRVWQR